MNDKIEVLKKSCINDGIYMKQSQQNKLLQLGILSLLSDEQLISNEISRIAANKIREE
jgi:hypothetical protein